MRGQPGPAESRPGRKHDPRIHRGGLNLSSVVAGLDPAIHDEVRQAKQYRRLGGAASWMAGSKPGHDNREAEPLRQCFARVSLTIFL